MNPEDAIRDSLSAHIDAVAAVLETQMPNVITATRRLSRCLLEESRIFVCGNAGSAINAQHFAVKMLGRLERERPGLPVFCLSENAALMALLSRTTARAMYLHANCARSASPATFCLPLLQRERRQAPCRQLPLPTIAKWTLSFSERPRQRRPHAPAFR